MSGGAEGAGEIAPAEAAHDALAATMLAARAEARLVGTPTSRDAAFSLADAYATAERIRALRLAGNERPLGYKIGFTNRGIWDHYGVHAPIWGPVWSSTVEPMAGGVASVDLAPFVQPRLEPEIMFGFAGAPHAGMSERELAGCIEWVAHGFEIVHTHFDGWRFRAADTVADFALHGRLFIGERVPASRFADLGAELAALQVTLVRDGSDIETGEASIVLGGPLSALRVWLAAMADLTPGWRVAAGDVVTTGTITDAAPLTPGEHWQTRTSDARLPGLSLHTAR